MSRTFSWNLAASLPHAPTSRSIRQRSGRDFSKYHVADSEDIFQNSSHMFALLHYMSMTTGKNITVVMPYADSLKYISDWFAQLWAESLCKEKDYNGKTVNVG